MITNRLAFHFVLFLGGRSLFIEARDFSEGRAIIRKGEKWGYINKTGEVVIETIFDSVSQF
ncbi:MAG: WG repeat-containing protein [Ignavibacteriae bacterium]|nr:WG repeat-containing protein [Ignavibacteriota bacterium]